MGAEMACPLSPTYPGLMLLARPFGGLDYVHDAVMFAIACVVAALGLWLNWPALAPLFAPFL